MRALRIPRAGFAGVRAKVPDVRLIARAVEGGYGEGAGERIAASARSGRARRGPPGRAGARVNELPHLHGVDVPEEVRSDGAGASGEGIAAHRVQPLRAVRPVTFVPSRVTVAAARSFARHPWQLALSLLGIALGVAVVVAIDLASESARRALAIASDGIAGRATHRITGGPRGVPEQLYVDLRLAGNRHGSGTAWTPGGGLRLAELGIELAPVTETRVVTVAAPARTLTVLGLDPFAARALRGEESAAALLAPEVLTRLLTEPGAVVTTSDTARVLGLAPGSTFRVRAGGRFAELSLAGVIEPRDPLEAGQLADLAIADVATGQELGGSPGWLDRIDVVLPGGAAGAEAGRRLEAHLPPGARLVDANERRRATARLTEAFELNLRMLGLLAVVVGAFLIFNTMTFSVVRRRWLIGMLRCLGVTRGRIFALVLAEAAAVGCAGALAGAGLGLVLAQGLVGLVVQSVNDHYFSVRVGEVHASAAAMGRAALVGVAVTLAAALVPAREATRIPPGAALARATLEAGARLGTRRLALAAAGLAGAGCAILWLSERSVAWGFAGMLAVVAGAALLTPFLTLAMTALAAPVARGSGAGVFALAVRGVGANLSRYGVASAALMIAVASAIGVGTMVHSFRATVGDWLDDTLKADFYVGAPGGAGDRAVGGATIAALRAIPGVAELSLGRRARVESGGGPVEVVALEMAGPGYRAFRFVEGDPGEAWPRFDRGDAVLVSEPLAWHRRIGPGDRVTLLTAAGPVPYPVAGVYRDYASDQGEILMSRRGYVAAWGDPTVTGVGVYLAPGADAGAVAAAVRAALPPSSAFVVRSNRSIREASLGGLRPHVRDHRGAAGAGDGRRVRRGARRPDGDPARTRARGRRVARPRARPGAALCARRDPDRGDGGDRGRGRGAHRPGDGVGAGRGHQPPLLRMAHRSLDRPGGARPGGGGGDGRGADRRGLAGAADGPGRSGAGVARGLNGASRPCPRHPRRSAGQGKGGSEDRQVRTIGSTTFRKGNFRKSRSCV